MSVTKKQDEYCHEVLPIDDDENVLDVFRHHPFAYILPILIAAFVVALLLGLATLMTSAHAFGAETIISPPFRTYIFEAAAVLSVLVIVFAYIPVYLRLQEKLVLTDEAVFQVLQPSLFSSKISQVSLERIADVTIRQDFLGNLMGYGKISIETPGEQDNYEYVYMPTPHNAAKQIIEAHENFTAALESGRLPTTLGSAPMGASTNFQAPITVDPVQYQRFLAYQQQNGPSASDGAAQAAANDDTQQAQPVVPSKPFDPTRPKE